MIGELFVLERITEKLFIYFITFSITTSSPNFTSFYNLLVHGYSQFMYKILCYFWHFSILQCLFLWILLYLSVAFLYILIYTRKANIYIFSTLSLIINNNDIKDTKMTSRKREN